ADLVNIILQRSEVLFDRPKYGQVIRSWTNGDSGPIEAEVDRLGTEIVRRAAAVIRAEYLALRPLLQELAPARLADIGCGYGFFDLFAAQDLNADLVLIDLESNEHRHFGFGDAGAAYSSLARARDFLVSNGVANARIETLNPTLSVPEEIPPVDLAVSFLSCGFHYPVDSYLPFLDKALKPGGAAIFDLRGHSARAQAKLLKRFGTLTDLDAPNKARRVLLRKDG
ncbi:MAG: class I SAM-dependent methyltransferase, partial [Pseudomonadota bacterium]